MIAGPQSTPGDSVVPNFQTVNAAGEPTAEFEGLIKALGLVLEEQAFGEEPVDKTLVSWIDQANQRQEFINGKQSGVSSQLHLRANYDKKRETGSIFLRVDNLLRNAGIDITSQLNVERVTSYVGLNSLITIGEEGKSSFPQLVGLLAKRKLNFGAANVEWAGGTPNSKEVTISHGLGVTPVAVTANSVSVTIIATKTYTLTNFNVWARTGDGSSPAAGTKEEIHWIAIG